MSKAAVGQNGFQMGTAAYFKRLNQDGELTVYLSSLDEYNYSQALRNQAVRVRAAMQEVYGDLQTHEGILKYIPSAKRNQLSNLVDRLEAVCTLASVDSGDPRACRSMLSGFTSTSRSMATENDLERGNQRMQQGGESGLDASTRIATVKEAVRWSESFTVGNDEGKQIFLRELTKGQSNGFLADLWDYYNYRQNPGDYCGKNGQQRSC